MKLISENIRGKFNLVCEGLTSRIDVTIEILKYYNLENKIKINEVSSSFFKNEYFATRPFSERLINSNLNKKNINIMRDWKVCLKEYLDQYYKDYLNENN